MTDELEKLQRKGTKPRHCCYGVRPLYDCQCEKDRLAALAATPAVGGEALQETISNAIMKVVSNRDDLGYTHFIEIRDSIFSALAAPPASPLRGRDALELALQEIVLTIAFLGRDAGTDRLAGTIDGIISRLAKADIAIRSALASASPPEQPAAGCGDPSCKDPDCTYGKGTNYLAQPASEPFWPHENCNCLMCLAEKSR